MTNKKYFIVEYATNYDDEYTSVQESYTLRSIIYSSKEEAEKKVISLITGLFNDWKGNYKPEVFVFSYYYLDSLAKKELKLYIESISEEINEWEIVLPKSATIEQCLEAYKISKLDLFKIIELEEYE